MLLWQLPAPHVCTAAAAAVTALLLRDFVNNLTYAVQMMSSRDGNLYPAAAAAEQIYI